MARKTINRQLLSAFTGALAQIAADPATVYLVGGATAVLEGWRATTIDIDIRVEPELDSILRAIPLLKERIGINIELASPLDFLPELPGWRERSRFVEQVGALTVREFDLYSQALAKLERGFDQDLADVRAMVTRGLVDPDELRRLFALIAGQLYRFPAVDPAALGRAVEAL